MSETTLRILAFFGICSFFGWILLFVGAGTRRDKRRREDRERTRAAGYIVDYVRQQRTGRYHNGSYWKPVIEFDADGEKIRSEYDMYGDPEAHPVGEAVDVLYDINRPDHFHLDSDEAYANGGSTAMRMAIVWILSSALLTIVLAVFVGGARLEDFTFLGGRLFGRRQPRVRQEVTLDKEADGFKYRINADGTAVIQAYTGSASELTLPVLLDGQLVSGIANAAFTSARSLVSLTVPGSYLHIPVGAFAGCVGLEELTLREGVSTVASRAFGFCMSLREVRLPSSLRRISDDAFPEDCKATFHVVEGSEAQDYCDRMGFAVAIE